MYLCSSEPQLTEEYEEKELLTLYDIMGEDHLVYAKLTEQNQISVSVVQEDCPDDLLFHTESNIAAWDSLVYFANQVISLNKEIEEQR